jgi:hypothetical protein
MMKSHQTANQIVPYDTARCSPYFSVHDSRSGDPSTPSLWLATAAGPDVSKQAFLEPLISMNKRHLTQAKRILKFSNPFLFLSFFSAP